MKVRCPTCKEWVVWSENPHKPFCSPRCKGLDLGKWADEAYRVPGEPSESEAKPSGEE